MNSSGTQRGLGLAIATTSANAASAARCHPCRCRVVRVLYGFETPRGSHQASMPLPDMGGREDNYVDLRRVCERTGGGFEITPKGHGQRPRGGPHSAISGTGTVVGTDPKIRRQQCSS